MLEPSAGPAVNLDGGVRVEWDASKLAVFATPDAESVPERPWELTGTAPDWKRWSSMRILSAAFEDGAFVTFAALRPRKAKGHDEDSAEALLVRDGAPARFEDFLLSIQFDGAGELRRLNVEAWLDADAVPMRLSGDVVARETGGIGPDSLQVSLVQAHLSGKAGLATLDVLEPA
jgi:hypothetical protein